MLPRFENDSSGSWRWANRPRAHNDGEPPDGRPSYRAIDNHGRSLVRGMRVVQPEITVSHRRGEGGDDGHGDGVLHARIGRRRGPGQPSRYAGTGTNGLSGLATQARGATDLTIRRARLRRLCGRTPTWLPEDDRIAEAPRSARLPRRRGYPWRRFTGSLRSDPTTIDPATQRALEGIEFVDVPDRVTA